MLEVEEELLGDDVDVREVRGEENDEVSEANRLCVSVRTLFRQSCWDFDDAKTY